ncbi:uncharacterized protein LOC134210739 [Armigeres subalbatus]|uniref:uncharacterized protein LOC134210739 n=1 Tax=Armigeres subalbatus TaxID=124917 RepID=UPI002ED64AE4
MIKSTSIVSLPMDPKLEHGKAHPLEFPLNNDISVLRTQPNRPSGRSSRRTSRTWLRLGQIVASIVTIASTALYPQPGTQSLVFLAINALIGTLILFGDSINKSHPLRRAFSPIVWFKVELWFAGLMAAAFHMQTIVLFVDGIRWFRFDVYSLTALCLVNEVMYLADWWTNFNKRQEIVKNLNNEQHNTVEQEAMIN